MAQRWVALLILTLARVSMGFQFQAPASTSPFLIEDLSLGASEIGFLIGLYMLPGIVLAVPGGVLGRRFGDWRMVALGLAMMIAGGAMAGLGENYPVLVAGRLLSGIGAVLLNVLMTKMVADWFGGRELVLAIAVFTNAFPVGIGLALLTLGPLAEVAGWPAAFQATAVAALAALLLLATAYRPHANDGSGAGAVGGSASISRREVVLVCLAGTVWGLYNGGFSVAFGFAPIHLVGRGMGVAEAGLLVGIATWLVVVSVQAGGLIAQRWGRQDLLMVAGMTVWGGALALLPFVDPTYAFVVIGLFQGLPVSIIVSMPATVLQPANRAIGMGIFFTGLYLGHAMLPPVAGWLQDATGSADAPFWFAAGLAFAVLPVYASFRLVQRGADPTP